MVGRRRAVPGVPRLAAAIRELRGDDAIGALRIGQVVGVAGVRRGRALLLLGRDGVEPGVVDGAVGAGRLADRAVSAFVRVVVVSAMAAMPVTAGEAVEERAR